MIRYDTSECRDGTAEERVQYALEQIEGAQTLLGAAAANLSPIIGLTARWDRVRKLYDQVRTEWYRLEGKLKGSRGKLQLDGINEEARRRRLAAEKGAP